MLCNKIDCDAAELFYIRSVTLEIVLLLCLLELHIDQCINCIMI